MDRPVYRVTVNGGSVASQNSHLSQNGAGLINCGRVGLPNHAGHTMCRQNPSNTTTSLGVVLSMSCWVVWGVARLADAVLSRGKITFYRRAVCA